MYALALLFLAPLQSQESAPDPGITWHVDAAGAGLGTGTESDPFTNISYGVAQGYVRSGDRFEVAPGLYTGEEIDFLGKSLEIVGVGGAGVTTVRARVSLDPQLPHTAARVASGEARVVIEGLRFTGGTGSRECSGFTRTVGGAIEICSGASVTVRGCQFQGNTAEYGGAIHAQDAELFLEDCVFTGPGTGAHGEALFLSSSQAELTGCRFEGLYLFSPDVPQGGGAVVLESSTVVLNGCSFERSASRLFGAHLFTRNGDVTATGCDFGSSIGYAGASIAVSGGTLRLYGSKVHDAVALSSPGAGVFAAGAVVEIDRCEFIDNRSTGMREGGALAVQAGRVSVMRSMFRDNQAGSGGAISVTQGAVTLVEDSFFIENDSRAGGGAVASFGADLVVRGSIFRANSALPAGYGGAVLGRALLERCTLTLNQAAEAGGAGASGVHLVESIAWRNSPSDLDASGTATRSLVGLPGGALITDPVVGNPLFWSPDDLHLLPGSPAIDALPAALGLDPDGSPQEIGAQRFSPAYVPEPLDEPFSTAGCDGPPTSSGSTAGLWAIGAPDLQRDRLLLVGHGLPNGSAALLVGSASQGSIPVPGVNGDMCLDFPLHRIAAASVRPDGTAPFWVRLDRAAALFPATAGATWHFQLLFRDQIPVALGTSTVSDSVSVTLR